ncbi:MAG: PLP-dependent aminotransferase family protein [Ruminococcus sp.]|nr:PLP-dependent aminotransferase family protein [Ruminococcus sp.]
MLYDFIIIDKNKKIPLYQQIYTSVRQSIENGNLKKGTKLPSIRKLSNDLSVSKTTITGAYEQLCAEGYIVNKPQSGYYVEVQFEKLPMVKDLNKPIKHNSQKNYKYDFSGKSIDSKIININEWKKYVKEVINQNHLMTSYGEQQGELELRTALKHYSLGIRSVKTSENNIIVGAGTQSLLFLLCSLIGRNKTVAMADSSYIQAEFVFQSFGYTIKYFESDTYGAELNSLEKIKPDIILINPNFTNISGENMPVNRRLDIIKWAKSNNSLIIEDDYNGELRYRTRPTPCVQNYDTENTIYLGSFSKVLLPAVRISYMALPDKYLKIYNQIKLSTNQTASKTEQLALAKYINNGKIDIILRKARRIYFEKSRIMLEAIKQQLNENTEIIFNETSLYISIIFKSKTVNYPILEQYLENNSIKIMPKRVENNIIRLSFSGIEEEKILQGIKIISEFLYNEH